MEVNLSTAAELFRLMRDMAKDISEIKILQAKMSERCNERREYMCRIEEDIKSLEERMTTIEGVLQRAAGVKSVIAAIAGLIGAGIMQFVAWIMKGNL